MTRRLRVLHVVHELDYGGMERLVGAIVRLIDHDRFESHILTMSGFGRLAEGLEADAQLHRFRPAPHVSMLWPVGLIRKIRAIAPDVVHSHSGVWYKTSLAARRARVPRLVHTDHGRQYPDPWTARFLDRMAARRTDVVVAVSDVLARQLAERVVPRGCPMRVVVNGVDTMRFRPQPINGSPRKELGLPDAAPVIGSIGRFEPVKAYDVMIEAFALLHAQWQHEPKPALVLVGDGMERSKLAGLIERLGLGNAIRLAGWRKEVERLYPLFDLFTLSSHSEGTSLGLLEAMSCGVCPIVTAVGGSASVLGERLRHRLVPPGDASALAAAWREGLVDRDRRVRDAAVARDRIERGFGIGTMVRQYERIYVGAPWPASTTGEAAST